MAKNKDFSTIGNDLDALDTVQKAVKQGTSKKGQQGTVTEKEAKERAEQLRTQGRKGCKATRINMAFTPQNHQFIKVMAKASGQTMTEFTNFVIAAYRKEHPELLEQANTFLELVGNMDFSDKE